MFVSNGDIIRTMNNKNLAKFLFVLLERFYNDSEECEKTIQHIESWLDEDYYKELI